MCIIVIADSPGAQITAQDKVVVTDRGNEVTLGNDLITIVLDKPTGEITELSKDGIEVTGRYRMYYDLGWRWPTQDEIWKAGAVSESHMQFFAGETRHSGAGEVSYDLLAHDDHHAHIRFTNDNVNEMPFALELHYILRAGDSGFYCYVVNRRFKGMRPTIYLETRYVMRIRDGIFTQKAVSPGRIGNKLFSAAEMGKSHQYADAERFPDGSVETKYDWAVYEGDHHLHGVAGSGLGFWVISASSEYCNGGPTKQNLSVEENEISIVNLRMFQAGHLGSGTLYFDRDEDWSKLYGPFFVYLNSGEDFDALWADAQQRSRQEVEAWPYSWVQHELYPLQRGSVRGQLTITDGSSPEGAWVILAAETPDWQVQGKGYIFWARADARGHFEIPKVRPGSYSLYAICDGVLDEYRLDGIEVTAGQPTDLGRLGWQPLRYGRQIWQIGVPDRSGREYRHGDDFRHWGLWLKYPQEFPNDVHFTVGQSLEREDWNYVQPAVLEADGTYRFPVWHIHFEMDEPPVYGQAVLRMPLAEVSSYSPDKLVMLKVSANGTAVGQFTEYGDDSGVNRSGIQGLYRNRQVCFDARLLQSGKNTITLSYDADQRNQPLKGWPLVSVIYDCLRLEISQ